MRRAGVSPGGELHGPVPGPARHLTAAAAAAGGHRHAARLQVPPVPSALGGPPLRLHRQLSAPG